MADGPERAEDTLAQASRAHRKAHDAAHSVAVGVVALLPRLYVAIAWPREPVWDGHYYDFGARRIAAGLGYSDGLAKWHPWCHWPVGYSGLLAGVYKVFGTGPHVATVANAVLGALLAIAVHRLARHQLGRQRAFVAGLLCALCPGLIAFAPLLMTEPVSALSLVVAGWVFLRFRHRPSLGAALGGAALGLGTLVHPTFVAFAPALGLMSLPPAGSAPGRQGGWGTVGQGGWGTVRRVVQTSIIATVCALVPVLPWTLRNCRVMDRCTFVSTNGGWNLAIGAFPRATGRFETLRSTDGCKVVTGQVQQDSCWRDLAVGYIAADPWRWLGLMPKKLSYTFDQESFPVEYLHEADPDRWPEARRASGRKLLTTAYRLLLTAAALGLVFERSRQWAAQALARLRGASWWGRGDAAAEGGHGAGRGGPEALWLGLGALGIGIGLVVYVWTADVPPFYWLAILIAIFGLWPFPACSNGAAVLWWAAFCVFGTLATHAVFFGEDRYHIVVTPLLCVLAAGVLPGSREDEEISRSPTIPPDVLAAGRRL